MLEWIVGYFLIGLSIAVILEINVFFHEKRYIMYQSKLMNVILFCGLVVIWPIVIVELMSRIVNRVKND